MIGRPKLVLASDIGRRWTLAEIAGTVGVSPVYLTQVFQKVEGVPLYRYQLRLRLARLHPELTDLPSARALQRHFRRAGQLRGQLGQRQVKYGRDRPGAHVRLQRPAPGAVRGVNAHRPAALRQQADSLVGAGLYHRTG